MEKLLWEEAPFPRCQELPDDAFRDLDANCMLLAISHGWFFQCHPDPTGEKKLILRSLLHSLKTKYPEVEVAVFFDFLSITQRPYRQSQAQRTSVDQFSFGQAIKMMHHCYCYADVLMHLYTNPPVEDTTPHVLKTDMRNLDIAQLGGMLQVVGLHKEDYDGLLGAYDLIMEIDDVNITDVDQVPACEAVVRYLKRPYGKTNAVPLEERGWVFLERFITMLKAAMLNDDDFAKVVFTNCDATRTLLREGAQRLRLAANCEENVLMEALRTFQKELSNKRFSGASADKIANRQTHFASDDAAAVAGFMAELVRTFGERWDVEKDKQQTMSCRFQIDVPLLSLTPKSLWEAVASFEPVVVVMVVMLCAIVGTSVVGASAAAVAHMDAKGVAYFCCNFAAALFNLLAYGSSTQHDVGVFVCQIVCSYLFAYLVVCGFQTGLLALILALDSEWQKKPWPGSVMFLTSLLGFTICKIADVLAFYRAPAVITHYRIHGRGIPKMKKQLKKGMFLGMASALMMGIPQLYLLGCVALRAPIEGLPPAVGIVIVLGASISKQAVMICFASVLLPKLRSNFASTDSAAFAMNNCLSYGVRLLVTSLRSTSVILALSLVTSVLELGSSIVVLHLTSKHIRSVEAEVKRMSELPLSIDASANLSASNDMFKATHRLLKARRRIASEVIFVINELLSEFYCIGQGPIFC